MNWNNFFSEYSAGVDPGGGAIAPLKPKKVTSFTMILYNSENNIRDIWPFRCALFYHSSIVKYASTLLQ